MLGAFLKAGINKFEISIKFCVFMIPILIFLKKKFFGVIIALFTVLKCKCEKNCTFSNIFQKVKSYFFANIYHSPCDSYWNSKKKYKIEAPYYTYLIIFYSMPINRVKQCADHVEKKSRNNCREEWGTDRYSITVLRMFLILYS